MKKTELKSLIKECLIEILAEGLGTPLVESTSRQKMNVRGRVTTGLSVPKHDPRLDRRVTPPNQALLEAIKTESGGNPVMLDILADTAATTLQKQSAAEKRGSSVGHDVESMIVAESTPEEIFGEETSGRWAQLAFSDSPSRTI